MRLEGEERAGLNLDGGLGWEWSVEEGGSVILVGFGLAFFVVLTQTILMK